MPSATMFDFQPGQAETMLRGIASAVGGDSGMSPTQASVLAAVGTNIFGIDTPIDQLEPLSATDLAAELDPILARGAVRGMVTLEIVAEPVTPELATRVDSYAAALGIDDHMLQVARDYSKGAMDVAHDDFFRSSYVLDYYSKHGNDGTLHRTVRAARRRGAPRSRARGEVEDARDLPVGLARPHGVGLLPATRLHPPGLAGGGRRAARPARLRALRRRLRHVGHRRDRGVLVHRRRHPRRQRVQLPRRDPRPVRDRQRRRGGRRRHCLTGPPPAARRHRAHGRRDPARAPPEP